MANVSTMKLSAIKKCQPIFSRSHGATGRRDSWPKLSHTWRLLREGPNFDAVGKNGETPMRSILETLYGDDDGAKSACVTAFRLHDAETYGIAMDIAQRGQIQPAQVKGDELVIGHRRAACVAIGCMVAALPLPFLVEIEKSVFKSKRSTVEADKKNRKPGDKAPELSDDDAMVRAVATQKAFANVTDELDVIDLRGKGSHADLSYGSDKGQRDVDRIDEGYRIMGLPAAQASKKPNMVDLARQAQTLLHLYDALPIFAALCPHRLIRL